MAEWPYPERGQRYPAPHTEVDRCRRNCPEGECYCAEPTYAEMNGVCLGCGAFDGDCYCGEASYE